MKKYLGGTQDFVAQSNSTKVFLDLAYVGEYFPRLFLTPPNTGNLWLENQRLQSLKEILFCLN